MKLLTERFRTAIRTYAATLASMEHHLVMEDGSQDAVRRERLQNLRKALEGEPDVRLLVAQAVDAELESYHQFKKRKANGSPG